jgi:hypothetical protein
MAHLALVTFLLMLPVLVQAPAPDERFWPEDPCLTAREIASRGPCLRPEDCGAFEQWTELYGAPRTAPLDPSLATGGGTVAALPPGSAPLPAGVPRTYNCLAAPPHDRH